MTNSLFRRIALLGAFLGGFATFAAAQDSGALLNVLVRKGILSDQEAEDIRAELTAESHAAVISSISGGKSTHSVSIYGRLQVQYAGLDTDAPGVATVNHLFARRVRLGVKAGLGANWYTDLNYEFGAQVIDKMVLGYQSDIGGMPADFNFGIRKVNLGFEENNSSGSLKAIERSGVTRYFVETNNGRRLGAAKYRMGAYYDVNLAARAGKTQGWFYGLAVTNPENPDGTAGAISAGNSLTNELAYWVDGGYSGKTDSLSYRLGVAGGYLRSQGGRQLAEDSDVKVFSAYAEAKVGEFTLMGEFLSADVEDGLGAGGDASPWGAWIQPSFKVSDKVELVARASYLDSDGRGVRVSDGVRSAPAVLTGDNLTEMYLGFTYFIVGSDLTFQLGYLQGTSERGARDETVKGVRSQLHVNF